MLERPVATSILRQKAQTLKASMMPKILDKEVNPILLEVKEKKEKKKENKRKIS